MSSPSSSPVLCPLPGGQNSILMPMKQRELNSWQCWEDTHLAKAQGRAAGRPSCIPKQVFSTAHSLMKLKKPCLGFLLTMGSTGTGFKTLMGNCSSVCWTREGHESVWAEGSRSTKAQGSAAPRCALQPSPCPQLCQTASVLGETAAGETLQDQASGWEIRLQSG